ncbi:MAG: hypothetical protein RIS47_277 [Bacteroidota bacterium]
MTCGCEYDFAAAWGGGVEGLVAGACCAVTVYLYVGQQAELGDVATGCTLGNVGGYVDVFGFEGCAAFFAL